MLVDDNEDAAELMAEALRTLGHEVRVEWDGPSAVNAVPRFAPQVALLDIGLPVMDGYQLARQLREQYSRSALFLIAVTGYGQESDRTRAREAGFDAHLVKPVDLAVLNDSPDRSLFRVAARDRLIGHPIGESGGGRYTSPPMSYSDILLEVSAPVGRITLNRPERRNPIGPSTVGELLHALARLKLDSAVRVVVLTGAGKVFSAGGDLAKLGQGGTPLKASSSENRHPGTFVDLNLELARLGKPTIAMVNGHALAGGLGLVVACDFAIASDEAQFGTPEINVGIWPMMIMAAIFRNVPRKRGLELMPPATRSRPQKRRDSGSSLGRSRASVCTTRWRNW